MQEEEKAEWEQHLLSEYHSLQYPPYAEEQVQRIIIEYFEEGGLGSDNDVTYQDQELRISLWGKDLPSACRSLVYFWYHYSDRRIS